MTDRKIYTFFEPVDGLDSGSERKLIMLWKANWSYYGWSPQVLNEDVARRHPAYASFVEKVNEYPSVNPGKYDYYCYIRWLAVAEICRGQRETVVMSDYDVFSYGFLPVPAVPGKLSLYKGCIPALVSGFPHAFEEQVQRFVHAPVDNSREINGRPHTSDMLMIEDALSRMPEKFDKNEIMKNHSEAGWETAAAVHYSNDSMVPHGKLPRYRHIKAW